MKDYAQQADKHCVFCQCNIMLIRNVDIERPRLSHKIFGAFTAYGNRRHAAAFTERWREEAEKCRVKSEIKGINLKAKSMA
jgi:hypothetical protein